MLRKEGSINYSLVLNETDSTILWSLKKFEYLYITINYGLIWVSNKFEKSIGRLRLKLVTELQRALELVYKNFMSAA